jgi:CRISPR-associated protein Cas1
MATLYVTEPGARIEKEYGRLLVTREDEVIAAVPLSQVSEVVLVGGVGATTPALLALLDQGVGLTLVSRTGQLRGRLRPAEARNLPLRQAQYRRVSDEVFAREMCRAIVAGKLRNCRTLARRMRRRMANPFDRQAALDGGPQATLAPAPALAPDVAAVPPASEPDAGDPPNLDKAFERLNSALSQVAVAKNAAEIRGLEGSGSRAYFAVLRAALRAEMSFDRRTRRPPRDPANALLSLAYSLLTNALFTAAEVAGLDPYAGFLHADKYGRPSLALDLVEEFRPVVADSIVLWVVNRRLLDVDDFETDDEAGTRLSRRGLRIFLAQFTRRLYTTVYHPEAGRAISYQKIFEVQARAVRHCIESGRADYPSFLVK